MKYAALIALLGVVLTIVGFVALVLTLPKAKVTICAVRPTGKFDNENRAIEEGGRLPVWEFAVTNRGNGQAFWRACIRVSTVAEDDEMFLINTPGYCTQGYLLPGQGIVTNMTVPREPGWRWSPCVSYWTIPTHTQYKIEELALHIPYLRNFVATNLPGTNLNSWVTNFANVRDAIAPQNGTNR
jgi:hypothetical protein